jgi:class 3 adenylate cyclase
VVSSHIQAVDLQTFVDEMLTSFFPSVPEPRKDHAVVMCRFAKDCFDTLKPLLKKLEVALGPDTGDLSMRFGLHSGPVTAGVLRGERARFQLFGDVSYAAETAAGI